MSTLDKKRFNEYMDFLHRQGNLNELIVPRKLIDDLIQLTGGPMLREWNLRISRNANGWTIDSPLVEGNGLVAGSIDQTIKFVRVVMERVVELEKREDNEIGQMAGDQFTVNQ